MKKVQDLVAGLASSRKSTVEIKKTPSPAYGDKAWRMTSIYYVIMKVKAGKPLTTSAISAARKTNRTADIVAAYMKKDWCVTCKDITSAHGVSNETKRNILCD
jgi:hypothetical protein